MRRLLWAGLALMAALGLHSPSANAQFRSYSLVPEVVAPGSTSASYSGANVNRNPSSPYYGYVYVCDKSTATGYADKGTVKIYRPDPVGAGAAASKYVDTGLRIIPSAPSSLSPWDVEVGSDDTVWIMANGGNTIESAPPVPPTGTSVTAVVQINKATHTPAASNLAGSFRGFAVRGPVTDAQVWSSVTDGAGTGNGFLSYKVAASNASTAGTTTYVFTFALTGSYAYGVAVDNDLNSYYTASGGLTTSVITKLDAAGQRVDFRPIHPFSPSFLGDLAFIPDASYLGGGYLMYTTRVVPDGTLSATNPHRTGGVRYLLDGTFLDGYGPAKSAASGNPRWSVVDLTARGIGSTSGSTSSAQYSGFDNLGNFYPTNNDSANNGQVSKVTFASETAFTPSALPGDVVISQVYGGGGNSGATYKNDFVEIYNRTNHAIDLTNWSVQYASSTGFSWTSNLLSGTIQPGRYFLIQLKTGAGGTVDLPTPDVIMPSTGIIDLSGTTGKVALVAQPYPSGVHAPTTLGLIDFVAYGATDLSETAPTPALTNTTASIRKCGNADTNDNSADFIILPPTPRNSAYAGDVAVTVTGQPANAAACEGGMVTFTAAATGSPAPAVQWEASADNGATFTPISGATSATYSFTATSADIGKQFRAVFTSTCSADTSLAATVVTPTASQLAFTSQPNGTAGSILTTQPVISAQDSVGATITCLSGNVTVAIKPGTGTAGAILSGTTTVPTVNGVATFTDLAIDKAGTGYVLTATSGSVTADSAAFSVAPPTPGPWGDVNADGFVTEADAVMVEAYLANPDQFSAAQQDRIQRYGDVNGTINRNSIGNDKVDAQDTMRMSLMAGGMIDAGTAGPAPAKYGDINDDGRVDMLDAVTTQRAVNNLGDAATVAIVKTLGRGDISPTVPFISFGDRAITQDDANTIRARAFGTEANPPAYTDYWPMHAPTFGFGTTPADTYTFTDTTGKSGDMLHQIIYQTQGPLELNGYTITEVQGTDDSKVGVYKGVDGSVYAMYLRYPYAFGNRLLTFHSPMKVFDQSTLDGTVNTWAGTTSTTLSDLGFRPVSYTGTLLARENVTTPAAGSFTASTDSPKSTWSQTARIRLDVAVLAGPTSAMEMQQAFFFDLMPFIGIVQRGQASLMGSPAPMTDRPLLRLDAVKVRGTTYNELVP